MQVQNQYEVLLTEATESNGIPEPSDDYIKKNENLTKLWDNLWTVYPKSCRKQQRLS